VRKVDKANRNTFRRSFVSNGQWSIAMNNEKYSPTCREGYPIPLASRIAISELRAKILEQQSNRLVALAFARLQRRIFIRLSF